MINLELKKVDLIQNCNDKFKTTYEHPDMHYTWLLQLANRYNDYIATLVKGEEVSDDIRTGALYAKNKLTKLLKQDSSKFIMYCDSYNKQ